MMKLLKRAAALLLTLLLAAAAASCGASRESGEKTIRVVTTLFPLYDWVKEIAGDDDCVAVTALLDNGVDLHSYQPTADDIITISTCDVFVYVGGESDEWVDDVLKSADNRKMTVVDLMDVLGDRVKAEEHVEGMQSEEEEAEEEEEEDEHVWLSLRNAAICCRAVADALGEVDAQHKSGYDANADAYIARLNALDARYRETVAAAPVKTLLFADRFPFRYLVEDYGLSYYAAFAGCSAESEASFETVAFLAGKVDELGLTAILQIEGADGKLAETVKQQTRAKDQKILTLDSLQSVTGDRAAEGATYLSVMEDNLAVLADALN